MLSVSNVWKSYDGSPLLRGVSFKVEQGETVCLLGPSGSGKSTLLRIIAGLEDAEQGRIDWDGEDLVNVPVHKRNFGLMFQDYALFPHRNVAENVAFGLRMQRLPKPEISRRVHESLEQVNLMPFASRRVTDLSGGEQQRVALARALAPRPRLLMLDEPLGALDRTLREHLLEELHQLLRSSGIPTIYVTHDQEEAFTLADRLILLHDGQVVQAGAPESVFRKPGSVWVARFLGLGNLVNGQVMETNPGRVHTALGDFNPALNGDPMVPGSQVTLLFNPEGSTIYSGNGINRLKGKVVDCVFRGDGYRVTLETAAKQLSFHLHQAVHQGEVLELSIAQEAIIALPPEKALQ